MSTKYLAGLDIGPKLVELGVIPPMTKRAIIVIDPAEVIVYVQSNADEKLLLAADLFKGARVVTASELAAKETPERDVTSIDEGDSFKRFEPELETPK